VFGDIVGIWASGATKLGQVKAKDRHQRWEQPREGLWEAEAAEEVWDMMELAQLVC
jgi:hypothetical protein